MHYVIAYDLVVFYVYARWMYINKAQTLRFMLAQVIGMRPQNKCVKVYDNAYASPNSLSKHWLAHSWNAKNYSHWTLIELYWEGRQTKEPFKKNAQDSNLRSEKSYQLLSAAVFESFHL